MQQKHEITRAAFVQAVRDFKARHQGKLKDLLNEALHPEAVRAFFSDPVIHAYLARPSIVFIDKHPQLSDSTEKGIDSADHYELKVYKYLPEIMPYRDTTITTSNFYTRGTAAPVIDSLLNQYRLSFERYNIKISFTKEALIYISELAIKEKTGARGLSTVLEKLLREFKFELPSTSIKKLKNTKKLLKHTDPISLL